MLAKNLLFDNSNNFIKKSGILIISSAAKFLIQVLVLVLFSRKLTLEDYGKYQYAWMLLNIFSVVTLFGLSQLLLTTTMKNFKYFFLANRQKNIIVLLLIYLIACGYIYFFVTTLTHTQKLLFCIVLVLQNISFVAESIAIREGFFKKILLANIAYIILFLAVHMYCFFYTYSFTILLAVLIFACCLKTLIIYTCVRERILITSIVQNTDNIGAEWFYLGLNDVFGIIVKWIDKWVILLFLPLINFAVYFNGTYEIPIFALLVTAIGSISLSEMATVKPTDLNTIKIIMQRQVLYLSTIILPSFVFLWYNSSNLITLFFGEKYMASIPIFNISIWVLPARIIYSTTILQVYNKSKIIVKGAVLDFIIVIILMLCLYPTFNMLGIAWAFVISTYIQILYYLLQSGKIVNLKIFDFFPTKMLLLFVAISMILPAGTYIICKQLNSITTLTINIFVCVLTILSLYILSSKYTLKNNN